MMKSLIFVVDNQPEIRELARKSLEGAGYVVRTFSNTEESYQGKPGRPALVIVGMDSQNRLGSTGRHSESFKWANIPRILLLDGFSDEHCLIAIDSGAEDYLEKPFRPRELVARVQAALRRSASSGITGPGADIVIDSWAMKLAVRGNEIPTTTLEFRLVEYLARHRGQVFTRDFLLDSVWGDERFVNPRSVDSCIRRIREKIEPDPAKPTMLKTIRGVGYRLDAVAAWQSAPSQGCGCPACTTRIAALSLDHSGVLRRKISVETSSS